MKQRITGEVRDDDYVILDVAGGVTRQIPLAQARQDAKLKAAILRNGWAAIPEN